MEILKDRGCPFVIVLGYPEYYPRFGFERASLYGIRSQWEGVPDEAFMIRILDPCGDGGLIWRGPVSR
jgi:putative acetyltransferase